MNYYLNVLRNYATFSGRARRKEFWYFALFNFIFEFIIQVTDKFIVTTFNMNHDNMNFDNFFVFGYLNLVYSIFTIIPSIAVSVRRLHDVGKSGTSLLIVLIPFIGVIWFLLVLFTDSNQEENQYGPNPKNNPVV